MVATSEDAIATGEAGGGKVPPEASGAQPGEDATGALSHTVPSAAGAA